jgi:hypothetical protein
LSDADADPGCKSRSDEETQISDGKIQNRDEKYRSGIEKPRSWILDPGLASWIRNTVQAVEYVLK